MCSIVLCSNQPNAASNSYHEAESISYSDVDPNSYRDSFLGALNDIHDCD